MLMPDQYGYAICRSAMARAIRKISTLSFAKTVCCNLYSFSFVLICV